jgi:hypothetical protein
MVSHLQPLSLLTPLPSRNGRLRRRDSDGKPTRPPFLLVRFRLSRVVFLSVRVPLAYPGSSRLRVFVAERTLPVSARSPTPRDVARHRSLYQKNGAMAR